MTDKIKRTICIGLAILVFAFICDSDCVEQGRFMQNLQRVSQEKDAALLMVSVPFDCADALVENRTSRTQPIEFRAISRQIRKIARSTELYILLVLIIFVFFSKIRNQWFSDLYIISEEARILRYIMLQDGKK